MAASPFDMTVGNLSLVVMVVDAETETLADVLTVWANTGAATNGAARTVIETMAVPNFLIVLIIDLFYY